MPTLSHFHRPKDTNAVAFFSVAILGLALSIALTLHSAFNRPPLVVGKAIHERHGLISTVTVTVRNRSTKTTYCPTVSISALNRDGLDIERENATPSVGSGTIAPGDIEGFKAVFTHITLHDYNEQLASFQGFIVHENRCGGS